MTVFWWWARMIFVIFYGLSILISLLLFLVTLLLMLSFFRIFLWFLLFMKVRTAKAFLVRALRLFRVWLRRPSHGILFKILVYVGWWFGFGFKLCFSFGFALSLSALKYYTLAIKKGDHLDPKNWPPITLLNANYKIASRSIPACLLKFIKLVVNKDPRCGVPDHLNSENVAFLCDVVDLCTSSGVLAALFSLDQEKAFDRVDWSFLHSTFYALGFGQSFIGWVNLF